MYEGDAWMYRDDPPDNPYRRINRTTPHEPRYDEQALGVNRNLSHIDVEIEDNPYLRKEVYSDMGRALKNSLAQTRGRKEVFTEKRTDAGGPSTIREAREMMYRGRGRKRNISQATNVQEEEYEKDDRYEYEKEPDQKPLEPVRTPARQSRAPTSVNGYSPPQLKEQRDQRQDFVQPSRPEFLAADGSIPTDPCGQRLVCDINGHRIVAECQEEARTDRPPFHQNIPHMARINQPQLTRHGINAFIVWNVDSEAP